MEPTTRTTPLKWILGKPLARPGRVVWLVILSVLMAPLRVATIAALLPVLKILFKPAWAEEMRAEAESATAGLRGLAVAWVEFLTAGSAMRALTWVLAGMFVLALLRAVLALLHQALSAVVVHRSVASLALEVHDALLRGAGRDRAAGTLLAHFSTDLDAIRASLKRVYGKVLREPLNLIATLAFLLWIDWQLAMWTAVVFPPAAAVILFLTRRLRDTSRRALARSGDLLGLVEEGLRGRRVVRSFGLEDRERGRIREAVDTLASNLIRLARHEALSSPLLELLGLLAGMTCSMIGAARVLGSDLSPEKFLTFYVVLITVLDPLRKLADTHVRVQRGAAAATRLLERIGTMPRRDPVAGRTPVEEVQDAVALDHVKVCAGADTVILDDVSFRARPGEVILVAGASGSGKSTLLDLLAGLRAPDDGAVRWDGRPFAELDPTRFRARVALVAQETFLFRGSVEENVTLGRPPRGVTLEEALEQAGIHERLSELPQGIHTPVEDHDLSVGERQRLSIARALYRDPTLLLLDESTSALDRPTEEEILRSVLARRSGRITFVVTHRLSHGLPVDRVLLLEDGHLTEQGTREELLAGSARFRSLVEGIES